jgi:hypothetical protein
VSARIRVLATLLNTTIARTIVQSEELNADYLWQDPIVTGSNANLNWHIGGGGRVWIGEGVAAIVARMPVGLDLTFRRRSFLEVFLEVAPAVHIVGVKRTTKRGRRALGWRAGAALLVLQLRTITDSAIARSARPVPAPRRSAPSGDAPRVRHHATLCGLDMPDRNMRHI